VRMRRFVGFWLDPAFCRRSKQRYKHGHCLKPSRLRSPCARRSALAVQPYTSYSCSALKFDDITPF
jgi:hypothetical protein